MTVQKDLEWKTRFAYIPMKVGFDENAKPVMVWWKYYEWREELYNRHLLVEYRPCPPMTVSRTFVEDFEPESGYSD